MKNSMHTKRAAALVLLPVMMGAAPFVASAEETLKQPAPVVIEAPNSVAPDAGATPDAVLAPDAGTPAVEPAPEGAVDPRDQAAKDAPAAPAGEAAETLLGKPVMAADGKSIGTVAAVKSDENGALLALHIETGGVLGFGTTLREVPAGEFTETGDGIQLRLASNEIESLSEVKQPKG